MANIQTPTWRDKVKIGNLMTRIEKHANGEVEMTSTQLKAAEIFLKKTLPDLSSTANSHTIAKSFFDERHNESGE